MTSRWLFRRKWNNSSSPGSALQRRGQYNWLLYGPMPSHKTWGIAWDEAPLPTAREAALFMLLRLELERGRL